MVIFNPKIDKRGAGRTCSSFCCGKRALFFQNYLRAYNYDKKDPIDFEELKKKKRGDARNEMMYEIALSIEMEQRSKPDKAAVIMDILKGNRSDKNV